MWDPRDPREPRSIAGARLRQLDLHASRLARWPPPMRDTVAPPTHEPPPLPPSDAPRPVVRRNWFLKRKP